MRAEHINVPIDANLVRAAARAPRWVMPAVKLMLVIIDAFVAAASLMLAFYLREGGPVFSEAGGIFQWSPKFAPYGALLPFVVFIRLAAMRYYDLYRMRGEYSFVDDGSRVFKATAIGSLLIVAAAFLYRGGFNYRAFSYARAVFVFDFVIALACYQTLRLLIRAAQTSFRQRGINLIPTLVVGKGPEAAFCIREMR